MSEERAIRDPSPAAAGVNARQRGFAFFPRSRRTVGIEWSPGGVRIAMGRHRGGRFELACVAEARFAEDPDPEQLEQQIRSTVISAGMSGCRANLALAEDTLHARILSLARLRGREAREAVRLGLLTSFPEIGEARQVVDYVVRGDEVLPRGEGRRYLAACASEEEVLERISVLERSALADPRTGVDCIALERVLATRDAWCDERPTPVLYFGQRCSVLLFFREGRFESRYVVRVGLADLVEGLGEEISLPGGQSVRLEGRRAVRLLDMFRLEVPSGRAEADQDALAERIHGLIRPPLERLIRDVTRWVRHYQVETMQPSPGTLLLCGEASRIQGMDSYLEYYLSIPTAYLAPHVEETGDGIPERPESDSHWSRFALAIGAAMDRRDAIQLVPRAQSVSRAVGIARRSFRVAVLAAVSLVATLAFAYRAPRTDLDDRLDRLREDLAALEGPLSLVGIRDALEEERAGLVEEFARLRPYRPAVAPMLAEIALLCGHSVLLDELEIESERSPAEIRLMGRARARPDGATAFAVIDRFVEGLSASVQFHDLSFEITGTREDGDTGFVLSCRVPLLEGVEHGSREWASTGGERR